MWYVSRSILNIILNKSFLKNVSLFSQEWVIFQFLLMQYHLIPPLKYKHWFKARVPQGIHWSILTLSFPLFDIIIKSYMETEGKNSLCKKEEIGADNFKHRKMHSWQLNSRITVGMGRSPVSRNLLILMLMRRQLGTQSKIIPLPNTISIPSSWVNE